MIISPPICSYQKKECSTECSRDETSQWCSAESHGVGHPMAGNVPGTRTDVTVP